ncbi:terminase small subunit [Paenibacillus massiliensis]|uniref:terminase small subunit n=1 Tax=Paenibacillus massiliensis TaxID=225917 RepID=UPI00048D86E7|nr:terminase small subunit [Paenibacillus massiliensis]
MTTEKQETFIREYMVDLNATQAAIRAGYSPKTASEQGSRLLSNVKVRARIDELISARKEKLELDAEWVLNRLMQVANQSMKAEPVMKWDYESRSMVETGEYTFDSSGANKALELIGKHLAMFKDKVEHSGSVGVTIVDDIK